MTGWRKSRVGVLAMFTWAVGMVPLTVMGIMLAAPFLGRRKAFFKVGPLFAKGMAWFCHIPFTLQGWEQLPEGIRQGSQSAIFMSNHESQMDPPVLIAALPVPAVFIAKQELKFVPFIGVAAWAAGVIFIDRANRERAIQSIQAAADEIRGGKSVVIFPEGTRNRTGEMLPFKKGGFALALDAGVPIVPMATLGGHQILPAGSLRFSPGPYTVIVGAPVSPSDYASRDDLMAEVRRRIETLMTASRQP